MENVRTPPTGQPVQQVMSPTPGPGASTMSSSMLNGTRNVTGGGSPLTHGPGELVGSDGLQTTTHGSTTPPTTSTAPPLQPTDGLGRTEVVDGGNGEGVLEQDSRDVAADGSHAVLAATTLGNAEVGRADDRDSAGRHDGAPSFLTPRASQLQGVTGVLGTGSQQASSAQTAPFGLGWLTRMQDWFQGPVPVQQIPHGCRVHLCNRPSRRLQGVRCH